MNIRIYFIIIRKTFFFFAIKKLCYTFSGFFSLQNVTQICNAGHRGCGGGIHEKQHLTNFLTMHLANDGFVRTDDLTYSHT